MKQFFKKIIKKHIKLLEEEHIGCEKISKLYPENSIIFEFLNLNLKWLEFKIILWETVV